MLVTSFPITTGLGNFIGNGCDSVSFICINSIRLAEFLLSEGFPGVMGYDLMQSVNWQSRPFVDIRRQISLFNVGITFNANQMKRSRIFPSTIALPTSHTAAHKRTKGDKRMKVEAFDEIDPKANDLKGRKEAWSGESSSVSHPCRPVAITASDAFDQKSENVKDIMTSLEKANKDEAKGSASQYGNGEALEREAIPVVLEENQARKSTVQLHLHQNTKIIERRKTVMSALVTNEKVFNFLFTIYKSTFVNVFIGVFWVVCNLNALFICFRHSLIPMDMFFPIQIIYTVNFCIHHSFFIRVDIVKELAKSFNFWFTIINLISYLVCFGFLWTLNFEIITVQLHSFFSVSFLILFDSHARKNLKIIKWSNLVGLASLAPIFFILATDLVELKNESVVDRESGVEIVNIRLQAVDNLSNLFVYLIRIIYNNIISRKSTSISFLSRFYEIKLTKNRTNQSQRASNSINSENKDHLPCVRNEIENELQHKAPTNADIPPESVINFQEQAPVEERDRRVIEEPKPREERLADVRKSMVFGITEGKVIEYDAHQTIYHMFVAKKYPLLSKILRSKIYHTLGIIICILSIVFSMPLAMGFSLGVGFETIGLLTVAIGILYTGIQISATCNLFLLRYVLRSFDYWYVMSLLLKIFISSGSLCRWDIRMVFWCYTILTVKWFVLIDTFGVKYRRLSYIAVVGIFCSLCLALFCKLNLGQTFEEDHAMEWNKIKIISPRITLSSSLFSVSLFSARFFWSYYKNPCRVLFITENITAEEIRR